MYYQNNLNFCRYGAAEPGDRTMVSLMLVCFNIPPTIFHPFRIMKDLHNGTPGNHEEICPAWDLNTQPKKEAGEYLIYFTKGTIITLSIGTDRHLLTMQTGVYTVRHTYSNILDTSTGSTMNCFKFFDKYGK